MAKEPLRAGGVACPCLDFNGNVRLDVLVDVDFYLVPLCKQFATSGLLGSIVISLVKVLSKSSYIPVPVDIEAQLTGFWHSQRVKNLQCYKQERTGSESAFNICNQAGDILLLQVVQLLLSSSRDLDVFTDVGI